MEDVDLARAPLTTAVLAVVAVCLFASGTAAASWKPLSETNAAAAAADFSADVPASLAASFDALASAEASAASEGAILPGPSRLSEDGEVAEREGLERWFPREPGGEMWSQEDISTTARRRRYMGNGDSSDDATSRYRRSSRQLQDNT